eukprot:3935443-Rhodomonas_salina.5
MSPASLRACYAVSGTELQYAATGQILPCYVLAMRCPVLSYSMPLPGFSTLISNLIQSSDTQVTRQNDKPKKKKKKKYKLYHENAIVFSRVCLREARACDAMYGIEVLYAATRPRSVWTGGAKVPSPMLLGHVVLCS